MPRVRRVEVERFRGINQLVWVLPTDRQFVALIGPGDAGKTSILTALQRALSDSWTVAFLDSDFHDGDVTRPIIIRVAVGDLDAELLSRDVAGLHLCGITADGELTHDPGEGDEACVVVELRVESDLEPRWTFYRVGDAGDPVPMRASVRRRFRAFRIDDRVDAHLRWSKASALGRLTETQHKTRDVLLDAHRAAHRAVADGVGAELTELTQSVQAHLSTSGSGNFRALRPGLDLSLPQSQGNLALYEEKIPLTGFGLGTRRLVGASIQQLAHPGESVLLIDELEHGLEPHRIAHLAASLRSPGSFGQVIVTTHSPVVLQHLEAHDLTAVRCAPDGTVQPLQLGSDLQAVLRSSPAAFLARHVLVAEGKTELGVAMHLVEHWDNERRGLAPPEAPASTLGVCSIEGGGSEAAERARLLRDTGYEVTFFLDGDRTDANDAAATLVAAGVRVVRWPNHHNTEQFICSHLTFAGLRALIDLARDGLRDDAGLPDDSAEQALTTRLRTRLPEAVSVTLDPTTWERDGVALDDARTAVAAAAAESTGKKKGWFKTVEGGKRLGRLLVNHPDLQHAEPVVALLHKLREHVYTDTAQERKQP